MPWLQSQMATVVQEGGYEVFVRHSYDWSNCTESAHTVSAQQWLVTKPQESRRRGSARRDLQELPLEWNAELTASVPRLQDPRHVGSALLVW